MKKRLLCLSDLFPAFLYDECPLSLQRQGKRIIKIFPFHAAFCLTRISQITRKRIISLAFAIRTATYER